MKQITIAAALFLAAMILSAQVAECYDLQQGTFSISGNSNIFFNDTSPDHGPVTRSYFVTAQPGYFFVKNMEFALQFSGSVSDSDYMAMTNYSVTPLIKYHLPVSEKSDLFAGIGAGYSWSRIRSSSPGPFPAIISKTRGSLFRGLVGWEYFLGENVAFNWTVQFDRFNSEYSYSNMTSRATTVASLLGLSLYFK